MNNQKAVLFILLLLPVLAFLIKKRTFKAFHLQEILLPVTGILFIACLILFSKTAVTSASKGLQLWLNVVFPSLFPFFVGSEILNRTGFSKAAGVLLEPLMRPLFNVPGCGCFAFALGITSGYPIGAKITADLRKQNEITKTEGERLLAFTNNSGPLFIAGAVAVGIFNRPALGLILLACHIAAGVLVGVIFRFYKRNERLSRKSRQKSYLSRFGHELEASRKEAESNNFGSLLGDAVKNSISLILTIGGFIILFSVIINLLLEIGIIGFLSQALVLLLAPLGISQSLAASLMSGFFEITTGTAMAGKAVNSSLLQQVSAAAMIIGWAGLSVHSQVYSIISKTDISMKPYLFGKFIQGILASTFTFLTIKAAGISLLESRPAFLPNHNIKLSGWKELFLSSCINILVSLAILVLCIVLAAFLKQRSNVRG